MRAWYVDRRNEPILDVRMIVSFACALVLVLAWLLPREETFRKMLVDGQADHVSIAYARLLVSLNPDDLELRMLLAAQYHQIGELELAWTTIDLPGMPPSMLRATLILEMAYASEQGQPRQKWEKMLEQDLLAAVADADLDPDVLAAFARAAYAIDEPRLAAQFFERRFLAHGEISDLEQAVRAWRLADESAAAAALFSHIGANATEATIALALDSYLAAGESQGGFELIDRWRAKNEPSADLAFRFVEFAQFADDPGRVKQYLAEVDDSQRLTGDRLLRLAGAAIATGELGLAARFMEAALLQQPDSVEVRAQLAEVYRWEGRSEAALEQWLALVERTGSEDYIATAWQLAQGLYHYDNSTRLLNRLATLRRLSDDEAAALRTAYELQGLPDQGIAALAAYIERHPGHRSAWRQLIALQEHNEYLEAASESWQAFALEHPIDVKERLQWADLLWEQYHTEEAVALMLAAGNPDYPEFWLRLSTYGWFLDDMELVSGAYASLDKLQQLDRYQYERFVTALAYTDRAEALSRAAEAWRLLAEPAFLVQALQWAIQIGEYEMVEQLIAEADGQSELEPSSEYWELVAYYHQRRGDHLAARQSLERALILHPQNVMLLTAYVWALNQSDDLQTLQTTLHDYRALAEKRSELWSAYASGFARLGDHRTAISWFARAASVHANDLELLLAYAGSLEAMGMADPAFRMRRHVVAEMARGEVAPGFTPEIIASAARGILSAQTQQALAAYLAEAPNPAFSRERLPELYLAQALRREHYTAARYWLQLDDGADVWERLSVAADERNSAVLNELRSHENPEVRIQAALALELPGDAYREARVTPGIDADELLGIASSFYGQYPSGWQFEPGYNYLSGLAIDAATFRAAGEISGFRLGSTVAAYALTDSERLIPGQIDELFWNLRLGRDNRFGEAEGAVSLLQSMDELIPGFTMRQQLRLDRRNSLFVGAAYQQPTEITALARAVAQRSGINLRWQGDLSRRDQLSLDTSWDHYQSRFGEEVGRGGQLEVRYNHAFMLGAPNVALGTTLYMTRNSTAAVADELQRQLLVNPNERLLPDATNRFAVNASVSRGYPGDLRWALPSPRYRLGAAVGYQWPENAPTLEFEASVGIRLLGNDEFSLKTGYTSALLSAVGGEGYRASLVYSKRLGR